MSTIVTVLYTRCLYKENALKSFRTMNPQEKHDIDVKNRLCILSSILTVCANLYGTYYIVFHK